MISSMTVAEQELVRRVLLAGVKWEALETHLESLPFKTKYYSGVSQRHTGPVTLHATSNPCANLYANSSGFSTDNELFHLNGNLQMLSHNVDVKL